MKKRTQKLLCGALSLVVLLSIVITPTYARENITVKLDGTELAFDVPPQIINGRTMVPLRKIFESMGAIVDWDNSTKTAIATDERCIVHATINSNTMKINGTPKTLDVTPQLINGRTLVPARFVAEAFGATVDLDSDTSTVIISTLKKPQKTDILDAEIDTFTYGYEKADFSKYNSNASENGLGGTKIYLLCTIDRIEYLDTDAGKIIIGYITDDSNKNWLTIMHTTALVDKNEYNNIIGKPIILLGKYEGFSGTEKLPVVNLYKLRVNDTGEIKSGIEMILSEDNETTTPTSDKTVLYTADGRSKEVPNSEVDVYKKLYWYEEPVQVMYATDGRTTVIPKREVESYKNAGWYSEPLVIMYAADGRTQYVEQSKVEEQKSFGWYSVPVVTMYAADGRTTVVAQTEVEAHKKVGWYSVPVVTMYAADGRTIVVAQTEVEAYKKVGWYTSKEEITLVSNRNKLSSLVYNKSKCGSMTGTITYQYNQYIGTRADVGAAVLLIQTNHIPTDMDTLNIGFVSGSYSDPTLYYTEVDGMGNYYLNNVPAGEYFLLIQSEETNQSPEISELHGKMAENYLKGKISSEALDTLKKAMNVYSFVIERIEVRENQTYHYSKDWGYTYSR